MTDTPEDWVLIKAAKRCGWLDKRTIKFLQGCYRNDRVFRALCDMIAKHEHPPVDRKLLCAREAARIAACGREGPTDEQLALRAIELWEEGFGK
jgi:hypothetical protein